MDIRTFLKQGKTLVFDGAMGTYFASLPHRSDVRCEQANLDYPEEILSIHRAYLEAGCQAIKTNTFSISAELSTGNDAHAEALLSAACRLAIEAAKPFDAYVFADIGPVPSLLAPKEVYCKQADWFLAHGVTHFLVETLSNDEGIPELAAYLKNRCPEAYLIVSFAVDPAGTTKNGNTGRELLRRTAALPQVDAVGLNCVSGPHHLLEYFRTLNRNGITVSVMPNAGYPTILGRRTVFHGQPDYFAERLTQIAREGASIIGGCCGTTPAHIAATVSTLEKMPPSTAPHFVKQPEIHTYTAAANSLSEKLEAGTRVIAVELDPPVNDDPSVFMEGVKTLRDAGVDAVTIADCPIGRPRADSSLLACKIKRDLGVEPLPHMTCRDRNLNATKALLLGLSMEGIHNVLLVTGDPIPAEDRSEVKSVFNFHSRKLANYVKDLNEQTLTMPFRIFGALNVNARNFDMQLKIAQEKEACGVTGFLTQPVLSQEALDHLKQARETLKGKILGGIYPIVSYRNACFLNNEIAGIRVCDEIISLYDGKDREEAEDLAVRISTEVAKQIAPYTDGLYLMTPFKRVELITRILKEVR